MSAMSDIIYAPLPICICGPAKELDRGDVSHLISRVVFSGREKESTYDGLSDERQHVIYVPRHVYMFFMHRCYFLCCCTLSLFFVLSVFLLLEMIWACFSFCAICPRPGCNYRIRICFLLSFL